MNILSIQSHVAYGYVGNRAATFPLQRMGHEVITINTVQFSNHTGYGHWTGDIFSRNHIQDLTTGLERLEILPTIDAVLSGYLGTPEIGEGILEILFHINKLHEEVIYCCDPVMGDIDRDFYVKPGIFEFFKNKALKKANIITPNQFEAEALSGIKIENLDDAKKAVKIIEKNASVKFVLITSLLIQEISNNQISVLLYANGDFYVISTPFIDFKIAPNGSGDLTAALFLGNYLKTKDAINALNFTINTVYNILQSTKQNSRRELNLIGAQEYISQPLIRYKAEKV